MTLGQYNAPVSARPKVHLVSGVSSVGKSTYLEKCMPSDVEVRFPWQLAKSRSLKARIRSVVSPRPAPSEFAVHYNILRPWAMRNSPSFQHDPPLRTLVQMYEGADIDAIVLVAPRQTLERRMREREHIEMSLPEAGTYPQEGWLRILATYDIQDVYSAWIAFLDEWGVHYEIVQSVDGTFEPVKSPEDLRRILAHADD